MTLARSLSIAAVVTTALMSGARPTAGDEQFPRGLMASANPRTPNRLCRIETRPVSFGVYDPLADMDLDAVGQIIYACANGNGNGGGPGKEPGSQAIRIEIWTGAAQTFDRAMVGPETGSNLRYNVYLDATRRSIWGNGFAGTEVYIDSHPPNNTSVTVPAFGRVFARQNVVAGQYVDGLHVVILF